MEKPLGQHEQALEWRVFVLMRNTHGYGESPKQWINDNTQSTQPGTQSASSKSVIYKHHPFYSLFKPEEAKKLAVPIKDIINKYFDAIKHKAGEGMVEGSFGDRLPRGISDLVAGRGGSRTRFIDNYEKVKETYPGIEDMTVGELGFPLYLTSIAGVSRGLAIDSISKAKFTIVDALNVSPRDDVFLADMIKKVTKYHRPYYNKDELDKMTSSVAELYENYYTDPEYLGREPKLSRFFKEVLQLSSLRDPGGQGFPLAFKDRLKIAMAAKKGDGEATDLLFRDYLGHRYAFAIEDMTPVWIYVKRPARGKYDIPRWTPYFHGFISGFSFRRHSRANTWNIEVDCTCPLAYMGMTHLKGSYVVVTWWDELMKMDGRKSTTISKTVQDALEAAESPVSAALGSIFQGRPHDDVLDHLVTYVNSSMTFLGLVSMVKRYGGTNKTYDGIRLDHIEKGLKKVNPDNANVPSISHKDYFRFDYIWLPHNKAVYGEEGISLPFCTPASEDPSQRENQTFWDLIVSAKTPLGEEKSELAKMPPAEFWQKQAGKELQNSPWLWAYWGHDLNQSYAPEDMKNKTDSLEDDIGWLMKQSDPQMLAVAWWISLRGRKYSLRDKWMPRVKIDPAIYPGSITAMQFVNNFALDKEAELISPFNVLQDMARTLRAHFFSDAQGNLCLVSYRPDDLPAIKDSATGRLKFMGWTPYEECSKWLDDLGLVSIQRAAQLAVEGVTERFNSYKEGAQAEVREDVGNKFKEGIRLPGDKAKEGIELSPLLFKDHDDRYVIRGDFYEGTEFNFNSSKIVTAVMAKGKWDFLNFGRLLELQFMTGYAGSVIYDHGKYGYRAINTDSFAVLPSDKDFRTFGVAGGGEYRDLLQALASAELRRNNARASSGTVTLKYQTLWMQLGRNVYIPDLQLKGYITSISDSLEPNNISGSIGLDFMIDPKEIIGNPYLEFYTRTSKKGDTWTNLLSYSEVKEAVYASNSLIESFEEGANPLTNPEVLVFHIGPRVELGGPLKYPSEALPSEYSQQFPGGKPKGSFHFLVSADGHVAQTCRLSLQTRSVNNKYIAPREISIEIACNLGGMTPGGIVTEKVVALYNSVAAIIYELTRMGFTTAAAPNINKPVFNSVATKRPTETRTYDYALDSRFKNKTMAQKDWSMLQTQVGALGFYEKYIEELKTVTGWIGHCAVGITENADPLPNDIDFGYLLNLIDSRSFESQLSLDGKLAI